MPVASAYPGPPPLANRRASVPFDRPCFVARGGRFGLCEAFAPVREEQPTRKDSSTGRRPLFRKPRFYVIAHTLPYREAIQPVSPHGKELCDYVAQAAGLKAAPKHR